LNSLPRRSARQRLELQNMPTAFPNPFPPNVRTVGVFAPANPLEAEPLARGAAHLRAWGLEVIIEQAPNGPDRFLAAPDPERLAAIDRLLRNPRVDALLAARGGYGCGRILDRIDWARWVARNLPVIGFSDITALHLAALKAGAQCGIFGPMLCGLFARAPDSDPDRDGTRFALNAFAQAWHAGDVLLPQGCALHTLQAGTASGPLVPATLAVLASLLGTPFMPSLRGAILVLEDVNEATYRVDRYLTQLRHAGILAELAGLVFGSFTDGDDAHWLPSVFAEFARCVHGPVVSGLPLGHCFPCVSLPVGRTGRLDAGCERTVLTIAEHGAPAA
jgi:muramoyltetrapeptide carboxypeptidase